MLSFYVFILFLSPWVVQSSDFVLTFRSTEPVSHWSHAFAPVFVLFIFLKNIHFCVCVSFNVVNDVWTRICNLVSLYLDIITSTTSHNNKKQDKQKCKKKLQNLFWSLQNKLQYHKKNLLAHTCTINVAVETENKVHVLQPAAIEQST